MLEVENISVGLGDRVVLKQVNLLLRSGLLTVVVGPNGSGKSTLLKALSGELELLRGNIRIMGNSLAYWKHRPREIARHRAVLPQHNNLFFNFSVFDVVMMGRAPHLKKREGPEDYDIVMESLGRLEISHLKDRSFQQLSGGEKQRVHLARVLAQIHDAVQYKRGSVLLLDEPTTSLDLKYQILVLQIAREYARRGATVVAVLHDLNQAMHYADEVMVLKNGFVSGYGETGTVLTPSRISHVFEIQSEWISHGNQKLLSIQHQTENINA